MASKKHSTPSGSPQKHLEKTKKQYKKKSPLITGTLLLTSAGFITRIIGFFNRIYLSQLIGPKEMGIYQLIFPVYMISFAFCCYGMELALSQLIASCCAKSISPREGFSDTEKNQCSSIVSTGCVISIICALFFSVTIYCFADYISIYFLKEERCALCLKLMAPVIPFTAIRSCLHGYYIGRKKTLVPASGQLIEQIIRVFIIWLIASSYGEIRSFTASLAVCGMVIGEIAGTIYTCISYKIQTEPSKQSVASIMPGSSKQKNIHLKSHPKTAFPLYLPYGKELLRKAAPLTISKVTLTFASSLESVLIPFMLTCYYKDQDLSLSLYGILTGMALPFITFPSTLTNSLSIMLLPAISEAKVSGHKKQIRHIIRKTVKLCLILGFTALFIFSSFGKQIGFLVFQNQSAGDFLFILSFLCPLLYLSTSASGILNGLGCMKETLYYNMAGILIRVIFILAAIPNMGIQGYLVGLLTAYLIQTILQWNKIRRSL